MNKFASLLKYRKGKDPGECQERARLDFPRRVAQGKLTHREGNRPIRDSGKLLVIGIASYSTEELALLDQLEAALTKSKSDIPRIEVFDVMECQEMSDFAKFIPGINGVFATPVVGVFSHAKLIHQASGLSDVVGILRRFNALPHEHARR